MYTTKFIKDGYRRCSCTSKTAKIYRFVIYYIQLYSSRYL